MNSLLIRDWMEHWGVWLWMGSGGLLIMLILWREVLESLWAYPVIKRTLALKPGDDLEILGLRGKLQHWGWTHLQLLGENGQQIHIPNRKVLGDIVSRQTKQTTLYPFDLEFPVPSWLHEHLSQLLEFARAAALRSEYRALTRPPEVYADFREGQIILHCIDYVAQPELLALCRTQLLTEIAERTHLLERQPQATLFKTPLATTESTGSPSEEFQSSLELASASVPESIPEVITLEMRESESSVLAEPEETPEAIKLEMRESESSVLAEPEETPEAIQLETRESQPSVVAEPEETPEAIKLEMRESQPSVVAEPEEIPPEAIRLEMLESQPSVVAEPEEALELSPEVPSTILSEASASIAEASSPAVQPSHWPEAAPPSARLKVKILKPTVKANTWESIPEAEPEILLMRDAETLTENEVEDHDLHLEEETKGASQAINPRIVELVAELTNALQSLERQSGLPDADSPEVARLMSAIEASAALLPEDSPPLRAAMHFLMAKVYQEEMLGML